MNRSWRWFLAVLLTRACALMASALAPLPVGAQQYDQSVFAGMRWRLIGPFRGGRALAVAGARGRPFEFYFGAVGGGVWKTGNAGRTWTPVFDGQPLASIGAIAAAPSNPNVIYVGTGEADMRSDISYGNGMYKSTDAGRTWTHIGLRDTRQIGRILVAPQNPDVVFVAALGHAYGPNSERGVFRSKDGGASWQKILFKDNDTGAIDLAFDPRNPQTIYAALWQTRRPPWNVYPPSNGPGSGLYKSTDGGDTWVHLEGRGLPSEGLGRIGIGIAPSDPKRIYLIVDAKEGGLYRSDDAGQNWRRVDAEARIWGRGWYFCEVNVDPKDPDTVYVSNTSLYRSRDGGQNFTAIKGAPGGDDYHGLWIDPEDGQRMILGSDQGAVVTVDGAQTWSSWYNQPTGQFYRVASDRRFPYWVYGAQQDSGAAATPSRSSHRGISERDWQPVEVGGESGYIAPDPLDTNIVYGGTASRYNWTTRQDQSIPPMLAHPGQYRRTWTLPLVFSPRNPRELYYGSQVLFRTRDAGQTWQIISPDLTREDPAVPANLDAATAADGPSIKRRGVIYTIAPSPLRAGEIWIGTDDGLIQVTRDDGKTWQNVTPPELAPWSKITLLHASRHDVNTVYAAVDRHRLEDLEPYIYRTRDGGKSWRRITRGIPAGSFVNAVREDPARKGLLYAGTETGVFVSFDDGENWQALQLNLPHASVRDLEIHDDDLVAATHGRAFWILDDVTPLRQLSAEVAQAVAWLFRPATAWRVRPGSDEGTPLPPEEPAGENPPDGAILDYLLKSAPAEPLTLEIFDRTGKLVRRFSSANTPQQVDAKTLVIPEFWVHPAQPPSATAGMHRFVWDLHYPGVPGARSRFGAVGPWALPGRYAVKLTVNARTYTQPLTVKMDPRVKTPLPELAKQFELARQVVEAQMQVATASGEARRLRAALASLKKQEELQGALAAAVEALDRKASAIAGVPAATTPGNIGVETAPGDRASLLYLTSALANLLNVVESADVAPTPDALAAFRELRPAVEKRAAAWNELKARNLAALNKQLSEAKLPPISLEAAPVAPRD